MKPKRLAVIVNPKSGRGRGRDVLRQFTKTCRDREVSLQAWTTADRGHATDIARSLPLVEFDGLGVIGGDGTVHEVVQGLIARGEAMPIPLGVIPAGTGNTLHDQVGSIDPTKGIEILLNGNTLPLDIVRVTSEEGVTYATNIVGWGGVVDINRKAEQLRWLGPFRYSVAALWQIAFPYDRQARIVLDDEVLEGRFLFAIGCNTEYTGRKMKMAPGASLHNGQLDVIVLRQCSRRAMIEVFRRVFDGTHLELPPVSRHRVTRFAVEEDEEGDASRLNLDGEIKGKAPFVAEVLPHALRIFAS